MTEAETEYQIFNFAYENVLKNAEYKNYLKRINALGRAITIRLGVDRGLLAECENLVNLSEAIYLKEMYSIGFKKGQEKLKNNRRVSFHILNKDVKRDAI